MLNSGTPESNYGYWYPGKNNDGGAGGGFEPRPWGRAWLGNKEMGRGSWWYSGEIDLGYSGALRSAATIVVDDPIFGPFAYGGEVVREKNLTEVIPRDGLRARFHIVRGKQRVHILLDRDGFAKDKAISFNDALSVVHFTLENRAEASHDVLIRIGSSRRLNGLSEKTPGEVIKLVRVAWRKFQVDNKGPSAPAIWSNEKVILS